MGSSVDQLSSRLKGVHPEGTFSPRPRPPPAQITLNPLHSTYTSITLLSHHLITSHTFIRETVHVTPHTTTHIPSTPPLPLPVHTFPGGDSIASAHQARLDHTRGCALHRRLPHRTLPGTEYPTGHSRTGGGRPCCPRSRGRPCSHPSPSPRGSHATRGGTQASHTRFPHRFHQVSSPHSSFWNGLPSGSHDTNNHRSNYLFAVRRDTTWRGGTPHHHDPTRPPIVTHPTTKGCEGNPLDGQAKP